jgi:diguanylate cyclase
MTGYILATVLATSQLLIGLAIGAWWAGRRARLARPQNLDFGWARRFVSALRNTTIHVADDVGQIREQLAAATNRLANKEAQQPPSPMPGQQGGPVADLVMGVVREVMDLNAKLQGRLMSAEAKLQEQAEQVETYLSEARTDGLTDLPNRRALDDELRRSIALSRRNGSSLYFMLLDVDRFKRLNDEHGHLAGDHVLRQLAGTLKDLFRSTDLVARYGGEEFAVLMPELRSEAAHIVAERVRGGVAATPFVYNGKELAVTVSLGLTPWRPEDDACSLVARADEALYASKRGGRDCCHLHDGELCRRLTDAPMPASLGEQCVDIVGACNDLRRRMEELTASA